MEKKLLDELEEGDPVSVALRGGAGWLHGTLVWRREGLILVQAAEGALRDETPYVIIMLGDVSAIAVPRMIEAPGVEGRPPGFLR